MSEEIDLLDQTLYLASRIYHSDDSPIPLDIHSACAIGNYNTVRNCIDQGIDFNRRNKGKRDIIPCTAPSLFIFICYAYREVFLCYLGPSPALLFKYCILDCSLCFLKKKALLIFIVTMCAVAIH